MENESSIKEIIRNSLDQVRDIIDADTIVGKQIVTSSGLVIIPISKLSMGIATGGLDLPTKTGEGGKKNFGGGGGSGVSVVPVGFLTITPEGKVDMIPMTSEKLTPVEVVADLIYNSPDIIGRIKNVLLNGYQELTQEPVGTITDNYNGTDAELNVELQPEYAGDYNSYVVDGGPMYPIYDGDTAAEAEQIFYADEGESYIDTPYGYSQVAIDTKEQKKRDKESAKLQKKADKSAEKMARLQAEVMALNMAKDAAQTPEETEYLEKTLAETEAKVQVESEKQAKIAEKQEALAASAPVPYEVQKARRTKKNRPLTREEKSSLF